MMLDTTRVLTTADDVPSTTSHRDASIIIVNWNTREMLTRCLESIFADCGPQISADSEAAGHPSSQPTIEVFVVDNASSDGSQRMVEERFSWVHLIENTANLGFASANNQAIALCQTHYLLLLNSDTEVLPGALEALIAFADAHPEAGVVGARLINPDGTFQAGPNQFPTLASVVFESWGIIQRFTRNPYYPSFPPERSRTSTPCDWVGGACLLARRSAVEQVGVLDASFFMNSEEVDWCYRMRQQGWAVWYTPDASIIHIGGASAKRSTATQRLRTYQGKVLFLSKHHGALVGWLAQWHFRITSFLKALGYGMRFVLTHDAHNRDYAVAHWAIAREEHWPRKS
jgi:N-acetylglucosaminyl-diphospho-decaprenol L-rhamnosyltransferase